MVIDVAVVALLFPTLRKTDCHKTLDELDFRVGRLGNHWDFHGTLKLLKGTTSFLIVSMSSGNKTLKGHGNEILPSGS